MQNINSNSKKIPIFLKNEVFQSILKEINNFLIIEKENIIKNTKGMSEQDSIENVSKRVLYYLKTKKANLMKTLNVLDKKNRNKWSPKIPIYVSVIYFLQYTNKYVKNILEAVSGIKFGYIKYVKDYLGLTSYSPIIYNIEIIKNILDTIGYELIFLKTQAEFEALPDSPAIRKITIKCPNNHEYSTNASHIKEMLKGERQCQKCSIKYTFEYIVQKSNERRDKLIFPKTKEEWAFMEDTPADRRITLECGKCKELRECKISNYDDYERCPICFHVDSRIWTWDAVKEIISEKGFKLYEYNQKIFEKQINKQRSRRRIHIQWRTCGWIVWTTLDDMVSWKFECGQCGLRASEGISRWTIEKIFSSLANELKKDPTKASRFSMQFREWLGKVKDKNELYLRFYKTWPDWLKESNSNRGLEYDGFNKFILVAFEYNGKQHYNIHTMIKVFSGNDKEFGRSKFFQQWKNDKLKVSNSKDIGVILLVIPYRVKSSDFQKFIFLEFKRFTGIDLNEFNIPYFDFSKRKIFFLNPDQKKLDVF